MSREGTDANKQANNKFGGQSSTAFSKGEGDVTQFENNVNTLKEGKDVAANPYLNPQYLAAVARLRSGSLDQASNAGARDLRANNVRTGGMNSTATTGAIGDLALRKARLGNELGADQFSNDWTKNVGYQLQNTQMPLESAKVQSGFYGTGTQGQDSALRNLADLQMASYGPWEAAIQAAGGGLAAGLKH